MNRSKIVFLDAHTLNPGDMDLSSLMTLGHVETYPRTLDSELLSRAKDADIIITNKVPITKQTISQLPQLKYIVVAATGYNVVDIVAARAAGIPVSNVKGYSTTSVSQHVFAMLLAYFNSCCKYYEESQEGAWSEKSDFSYWHRPIIELHGKSFGILGLGDIGKAVARIAVAMGMDIIAYSRKPKRDQMDGVHFVSQEELFAQADILTLHAPINESTKEIINANTLALMKKSAILINTARGGLINEADLATALEKESDFSGTFGCAISRTTPNQHILMHCKNCYVTPHQAWASLAARRRLLAGLVGNIEGFAVGQLKNLVN